MGHSLSPNSYPPVSDKLPGGHGQPSLTVWLVLGNTRGSSMKYSIEICGFDYHPAVIINGRYAYFGYTRRSFNQAWEECWILATPIADQNYPKHLIKGAK